LISLPGIPVAMEDTLSAILSKKLAMVRSEDSVGKAVGTMVRRDIGAVLVTRKGRVAGIVTERDILRALARGEGARNQPFHRKSVSSVMPRRKLITARPGDSPLRALDLMSRHQVRRIPVAAGGKVLGIVTERDLVKWLLGRPEVILDLLSPEYPAVSRDALVALLKEMHVRGKV
jgi:CBS domain-containing protein